MGGWEGPWSVLPPARRLCSARSVLGRRDARLRPRLSQRDGPARPRGAGACLSFSSELPRGHNQALEPFVAIEPRVDHGLQAHGQDLCMTGLQHGQHYTVTAESRPAGADGSTLPKDVSVDVQVPDRDPQVSFDQGKTLLPYTQGRRTAAQERQCRQGACRALPLRRARRSSSSCQRLVRPGAERLEHRHGRRPQPEGLRRHARHRVQAQPAGHDRASRSTS